jgi:hypothetical protein
VAARPRESIPSSGPAALGFLLLALVLGSLRFLWPGDVRFGLDEALVVRMAAKANEKGVLAVHSLATPRSTSGPVPVWIYQAVLASHVSFSTLWWLKVSIFTAALFYAGLRLLRSLPFLRPETLILLGLSPYVWFYSRDLWDNSWEIPLSAVALSSYLGFCCRPNRRDMLLTLVPLTLGFLTHLMMVAPLLGIAVHFLLFHRTWGRRHAGFLLLVGAACGAVASSYLGYLLRNPRLAGISVRHSHLWLRYVSGAANALLAPRYFMLIGFDYVAGRFWWLPPPEVPLGLRVIVPIAFAVTGIAVLYFFIGLRESCRCVRRAYEARHWDRKAELLTLFVLIYFVHAAIGGLKQLGDPPHYLNALWLVIFVFVSLGVTAVWGERRWRRTFWVYGLCLWIGLLYVVGDLHHHSGTRQRYGPTLENQLAVADALCRYPIDTPVVRELSERGTFPKTVHALRMVRCAHKEPDPSLKDRRLRIGYVEPANSRDGRIALFESWE